MPWLGNVSVHASETLNTPAIEALRNPNGGKKGHACRSRWKVSSDKQVDAICNSIQFGAGLFVVLVEVYFVLHSWIGCRCQGTTGDIFPLHSCDESWTCVEWRTKPSVIEP